MWCSIAVTFTFVGLGFATYDGSVPVGCPHQTDYVAGHNDYANDYQPPFQFDPYYNYAGNGMHERRIPEGFDAHYWTGHPPQPQPPTRFNVHAAEFYPPNNAVPANNIPALYPPVNGRWDVHGNELPPPGENAQFDDEEYDAEEAVEEPVAFGSGQHPPVQFGLPFADRRNGAEERIPFGSGQHPPVQFGLPFDVRSNDADENGQQLQDETHESERNVPENERNVPENEWPEANWRMFLPMPPITEIREEMDFRIAILGDDVFVMFEEGDAVDDTEVVGWRPVFRKDSEHNFIVSPFQGTQLEADRESENPRTDAANDGENDGENGSEEEEVGDDFPNALKCPICLQPFTDPFIAVPSARSYCFRCLDRIRQGVADERLRDPFTRETIGYLVPNRAIADAVAEYKENSKASDSSKND